MEIICLSVNARQFNIAYSIVHVQLCFLILFIIYYFSITFFPARVFMLPDGLLEQGIIKYTQHYFKKNMSKTFEAKSLKIFENIKP